MSDKKGKSDDGRDESTHQDQELDQGIFFNRRILVVDDNRDVQQDYDKILNPPIKMENTKLKQLKKKIFGDNTKTTPLQKEVTEQDDPSPSDELGQLQIPSPHYLQFDLTFATQGEEAIEIYKKSLAENKPFSVVFMDVRMPPGMDGIECLYHIKKMDPHVESVVCSAFSDISWKDVLAKFGATDKILYLRKPFTMEEAFQLALCLTQKWSINNHFRQIMKLKEDELQKQNMALIESSKLSTIGEMASGIAHEINNPLTIIKGHLGILNRMIQKPQIESLKLKDLIRKSQDSLSRVAKIVRGLKSLSQNENPEEDYSYKDIREMFDEVLPLCVPKFYESSVEFHFERPKEAIPLPYRTVQLSQVVLNLLNNSFDAVLNQETRAIRVTIDEESDEVTLKFFDSGPGVPKEVQEKMFKAFFTTKGVTKGTGLGLSICKGIVDSHHGKFYLDQDSKETCFVVKLPKKKKEA